MRKLYRHALRRQAEKADQKTILLFRYLWKRRREKGYRLGEVVEQTIRAAKAKQAKAAKAEKKRAGRRSA